MSLPCTLPAQLEILPDVLNEISREDELQPAIFQFNVRPSKGIPLLCQAYRVPMNPKSIANILHMTPGLMSIRVGEFLAKKENEDILTAYFQQVDLQYPFVEALRMALGGSLHLPGESEDIDRIVQTWARCYVMRNPRCGMDGEQAYILAFACVLLNSDLHNPAVRRRMTVDEFISNVRGAVPATSISDHVLRDIYNQIKEKPFAFRTGDSDEFCALAAPRVKGKLEKKSSQWASKWTTHFFVLTNSCIYYFKDDQEVSEDSPQGMVQLVSVTVTPVERDRIEISAISGDLQYVKFKRKKPEIVRNVKSMQFRAKTRKMRDKWLYRMLTSCVYTNFTGDAGSPGLNPLDMQRSIPEMTETTSDSAASRIDLRSMGMEVRMSTSSLLAPNPSNLQAIPRPLSPGAGAASPFRGAGSPMRRSARLPPSPPLPVPLS